MKDENLLEDFGEKLKHILACSVKQPAEQTGNGLSFSLGHGLELEKELMIYLITEVDTSSLQFTSALKLME